MLSDDTDRTVAIQLKHLSPTWVKKLDEEVGKRGRFCELTAIFRGLQADYLSQGRIAPVT